MTQWFIKTNNIDFLSEFKDLNISPIVGKLLANRGVKNLDEGNKFLYGGHKDLYSPSLMLGIEEGSKIIYKAIKNNEKIRVVGDYDVDGIISTYILVYSINKLGGIVDYKIPDRLRDGYGINKRIIQDSYNEDIDLIITCDNGIAALDEIKYAKELGLKVIITDHHEFPYDIVDEKKEIRESKADVIINPKNPNCNYPYKNLCGAGVAYKLLEYLLDNYFEIAKNEIYKLLEYVSIATIADVMDLRDENRIIVDMGLKMINDSSNLGLKTLIDILDINGEIGVYHIGFIIGPALNATGRLDLADKGVELLLSKDPIETKILAEELRELNNKRKDMTKKGTEETIDIIESTDLKNQDILVIYNKNIHESVAGIVAGRVKDKYNKPTIVLTNSKESGIIKGSARSISEYNMYENLVNCKEYLLEFGGHPLAAGLSLKKENLEIFREKLNINSKLTEDDLKKKYYIDLGLPIEYVNYELINEIKLLEPHGIGNPRPLFGAKDLYIERAFKLGKNKNVLKLILSTDKGVTMESILFNNIEEFERDFVKKYSREELEKIYRGDKNKGKIDVLYSPDINEYRGRTNLQLIIENFRI